MFSSDSRFFIFLLIPFISWFSFDVEADVIEEIVVKGTWRQEGLNQSDGSIVILDQQDLEAHTEQPTVVPGVVESSPPAKLTLSGR